MTRPHKQVERGATWWIPENRIIYCHIQLDTAHKAAHLFALFPRTKRSVPGYEDVRHISRFLHDLLTSSLSPLPSLLLLWQGTANDNILRSYCTFDTPVTKLYFIVSCIFIGAPGIQIALSVALSVTSACISVDHLKEKVNSKIGRRWASLNGYLTQKN